MSYEGFDQFICENGHYYTIDASMILYGDDNDNCPICKAKAAWYNCVDTTNGSLS